MDGIRHLSVSSLLSPSLSNQGINTPPLNRFQQDFLTSSSLYDRSSPGLPHVDPFRPQGSFDMHTTTLPAIGRFDDQRNVDNAGSRLRYSSTSTDNMEDNDIGSSSDDDDDIADCEKLVAEMTSKLDLSDNIANEASQFAKVSACIVDAKYVLIRMYNINKRWGQGNSLSCYSVIFMTFG